MWHSLKDLENLPNSTIDISLLLLGLEQFRLCKNPASARNAQRARNCESRFGCTSAPRPSRRPVGFSCRDASPPSVISNSTQKKRDRLAKTIIETESGSPPNQRANEPKGRFVIRPSGNWNRPRGDSGELPAIRAHSKHADNHEISKKRGTDRGRHEPSLRTNYNRIRSKFLGPVAVIACLWPPAVVTWQKPLNELCTSRLYKYRLVCQDLTE